MSDRPIRILIADDHAMVRTGISTWIASRPDMLLAGEASDGDEAVRLASQCNPDVILMDLVMPHLDGIAATQAIIQQTPDAKILIVTSFSEQDKILAAIRAGALGFVLKEIAPEELFEAIRVVANGRIWLSSELTRLLLQQTQKVFEPPVDSNQVALTEREKDVLRLVAQGLSDQDIAGQLVISKGTVRYHLNNVLSKLHLENRTQAALYAIRNGFTGNDDLPQT